MNIAVAKAAGRPDSWQARPALQQPHYADPAKLARVLEELARLPPVVVSWEVDQLKEELAAAQRGERFLLQGGDCAEGFSDCESDTIARKLKILLQMSVVLLHGSRSRSSASAASPASTRSRAPPTSRPATASRLPSYRGDIVNHAAFTAADREAGPGAAAARLRARGADAQFRARAGGWRLRRPASPGILGPRLHAAREAEGRLPEDRRRNLRFARFLRGRVGLAGARGERRRASTRATRGCTCTTSRRRRATCSAGSAGTTCRRTCRGSACARPSRSGAHVEYFRGIANPIGVKVGESAWTPRRSASWSAS